MRRIWTIVIIAMTMWLVAGCEKRVEPDQSQLQQTQLETTGDSETVAKTPVEPATPVASAEPTAPTAPVEQAPIRVRLQTTMGDIVIELNEQKAPVTCANFLRYVNEGFYSGTLFHRVIPNFMIQGGGFTINMAQKPVHESIVNESSNGLKNDRGTVAMARYPDLNSATSQFFINHVNNTPLNYGGPYGGYAVFARVTQGMDVVDKIIVVPTRTVGGLENVPVTPVIINSAAIIE